MDDAGAARAQAGTDSGAGAPAAPHSPRPSASGPESAPGWTSGLIRNRRLFVRVAVAVAFSIVACLLLARFAAPNLPAHTDIVGYSTFENFNSERQFWHYRLAVYGFPFFVIVGYALLARFGPLRSTGPRPIKRAIELVEPASGVPVPTGDRCCGGLARILLPAMVVVIAGSARTGHTDLIAVAMGGAYLVVVIVAAAGSARFVAGQWRDVVAVTNGVVGAIAAMLGLWFVAAHTVVQTPAGLRCWPWLPWWLPVLAAVTIIAWSVRQLRGGRPAGDVELTLLTVIVGAIALFLAMSVLPGEVQFLQGYDDAAEMAGASVLAHGYLPWRDLLFVHGVFPDVLAGSLGRAVFGDTVWGGFAQHSVLSVPLFWVGVYLFAVWVSRRNPWFSALTFSAITIGLRPLVELERSTGQPVAELVWSERFIGVPLALIVFGETLRRRSVAWAVGLTLLLFVEEILVPETIFVAAPALGCVVAADLVHRRPGRTLWRALRLTRWCVATGLVAVGLWAALLAAFGALRAFVDYYLVMGPGHSLAGALPPSTLSDTELHMFFLDVLCVLVTIWAVAVKVVRRSDWEARDWAAVAAAGFAALYLEKALGRFDPIHVWQVFGATVPLLVAVGWRLFNGLNQAFVAWCSGRRQLIRFAQPMASILVPLMAVGMVLAGPLHDVGGQHQLAGVTETSARRLGYTAPGVIDTGTLRDLDTAIRAYAGADGPVLDMTNSLGYLYYLLDRVPGTRFIHVSMAIPTYAQQLLIGELKTVRPPVVIYDSTAFGLPVWDGISSNVRHYEVSEYILHGWTPVLRTHGVLVMARNDLVAAKPAPALSTPPQTADLYFSGPSCRWGATPNYLPLPDAVRTVTLPVRPGVRRTVVNYAGWAVDPVTNRPATEVLIADGERVVGTVTPSINRPDMAQVLHVPASVSGFEYNAVFDTDVHPLAYLVGADGMAHLLNGSRASPPDALHLPNGKEIKVAPAVAGFLEIDDAQFLVGEITLPGNMALRDYDLALLSATAGLGGNAVALTDQIDHARHEISATWLNQAGSHLAMRVGSCPQWYGYDSAKPVYIMQSGGPSVTSITLATMRSH